VTNVRAASAAFLYSARPVVAGGVYTPAGPKRFALLSTLLLPEAYAEAIKIYSFSRFSIPDYVTIVKQ